MAVGITLHGGRCHFTAGKTTRNHDDDQGLMKSCPVNLHRAPYPSLTNAGGSRVETKKSSITTPEIKLSSNEEPMTRFDTLSQRMRWEGPL